MYLASLMKTTRRRNVTISCIELDNILKAMIVKVPPDISFFLSKHKSGIVIVQEQFNINRDLISDEKSICPQVYCLQ